VPRVTQTRPTLVDNTKTRVSFPTGRENATCNKIPLGNGSWKRQGGIGEVDRWVVGM
jgi:hypothetical protein